MIDHYYYYYLKYFGFWRFLIFDIISSGLISHGNRVHFLSISRPADHDISTTLSLLCGIMESTPAGHKFGKRLGYHTTNDQRLSTTPQELDICYHGGAHGGPLDARQARAVTYVIGA